MPAACQGPPGSPAPLLPPAGPPDEAATVEVACPFFGCDLWYCMYIHCGPAWGIHSEQLRTVQTHVWHCDLLESSNFSCKTLAAPMLPRNLIFWLFHLRWMHLLKTELQWLAIIIGCFWCGGVCVCWVGVVLQPFCIFLFRLGKPWEAVKSHESPLKGIESSVFECFWMV